MGSTDAASIRVGHERVTAGVSFDNGTARQTGRPLGAVEPPEATAQPTNRVKRKENPALGGVEKVAAGGGRDGRRCLINAADRLGFRADRKPSTISRRCSGNSSSVRAE